MLYGQRFARMSAAAIAIAAVVAVVAAAVCGAGYAAPASAATAGPPDILTAPTLVASTADGNVGYRDVGHGSPVILLSGSGATMDNWAPSFVDALAARHRVITLDYPGVGETSAIAGPLTIVGLMRQVSALITTLRLRHPAVVGWSMGGMVAQVLAVLRPWQVSRLILAGSQPGNGQGLPVPQSVLGELGSTDLATVISLLFPADQEAAGLAYFEAIFQYPDFYAPPAAVAQAQLAASQGWIAGDEPAGHLLGLIHVPTLVADGTEDVFDPVANDKLLARDIPRARLVLYPDAGHAFLFQDASSFLPLVENFIGCGDGSGANGAVRT